MAIIRQSLLLGAMLLSIAAYAEKGLIITRTDNTVIQCPISDNPQIMFTNTPSAENDFSHITIVTDRFEIEESSRHLKDMKIGEVVETGGVEDVQSSANSSINQCDGDLTVTVLYNPARLSIVGADGVVYKNVLLAPGEYNLGMNALAKGLYIVTVDDVTLKILIK